MLNLENQVIQNAALTMQPLTEEPLNLLVAFFSICMGVVAMLVLAATQRAVPLIRDWIQSQSARASERRRLRPKRPHPPLDEQRDR